MVVEQGAPFEGCAEKAVEEQPEDSAQTTYDKHHGISSQCECARGGDDSSSPDSRESATEADGPVGSCAGNTESRDHAGASAQYLAEFRGHRIGGCLA